MKLLIVLALVALAFARPEDHYDSKYDNFDVDEVMQNERLLSAYTHCFIGDGKCTPEGRQISTWIPDGFQTSCGKCTDKQKELAAKFIKGMRVKMPAEYNILLNKHDPEKKHLESLEDFITKYAP